MQQASDRLSLDWRSRPPRDCPCPSCNTLGPKPFVVAAGGLDLFACPHCESRFFADLRPPEYGRSEEPDAYLKFYLEIGAGIDQLIRHLFALPLRRGDRYLEVGCGFGFALDFGRHTFGLDV